MAVDKLAILSRKPKTEPLVVPELGEVIIRGMSGEERDGFEKSLVVGKGKRAQMDAANFRAKMLVRCLVNEAGERLFTDEDAVELGKVDAATLEPMFDVARRLSGMSESDVGELGKLDSATMGGASSSSH